MELLVVVIVLGVLSAVAAPKLSRVLETRKTAEAEEMLAALRTEQEKRCILGKNYTADETKLPIVAAAARSKNYVYSLKETGAEASRGEYTLKMPSYKDGRLCCEGAGCVKLNKNYVACSNISVEDECLAEDTPVLCEDCGCAEYAAAHACECNPSAATCCSSTHSEGGIGSQPCECGSVEGIWHCDEDTSYSWVLNITGSCAEKPGDEENTCSDGTKQHRSYECVNGAWSAGAWDKECPGENACDNSHKEGEPVLSNVGDLSTKKVPNLELKPCLVDECGTTSKYWHCGEDTGYKWVTKEETNCEPRPDDKTKECEEGTGTQTATWTCTSSGWVLGEYKGECDLDKDCDESKKPEDEKTDCNSCGEMKITWYCNRKKGEWVRQLGECSKTPEECGVYCGTSQAECSPGKTDFESGHSCSPGKGHPAGYVTKYGSDCTGTSGLVCLQEDSGTDPSFGSGTNQLTTCSCPTKWYSGRFCNAQCRWENNSCVSTNTGSSGGGTGPGGGGCSYFRYQATNFDADSRITWCTVSGIDCTSIGGKKQTYNVTCS